MIKESERRLRGTDDLRRRYYRLTSFGGRMLTAEIGRVEDQVKAARAKRRTLNAESSR